MADLREEIYLYEDEEGQLWKSTFEKGNMVAITKEEYHGLKNILRIVKDRAIQQIDKSKADDNGYTLKAAELKRYDIDRNEEAWYITKSTPYSISIPIEEAGVIIKNNLRDYYGLIELPQFVYNTWGNDAKRKMTEKDIINAYKQRNNDNWEYDFYVDNSGWGREVKCFVDSLGEAVAFKITKITSNYGQGNYEVSYWATGLI